MEALTPTLEMAVRIYWSLLWRHIVFGLIPSFIIGFVVGMLIGIVGYFSGFDKTTVMSISFVLNLIIGFALSVTVSIFIIKHILGKQYKTFRIAILPVG